MFLDHSAYEVGIASRRTANTGTAVEPTSRLRPCLAVSLAFGTALFSPFALAQNQGTVGKYEPWRGGLAFKTLFSFHAVGTILMSGLPGTVDVSSEEIGGIQERADLGRRSSVPRSRAGVLGRTDTMGTVQIGRNADLVLLDTIHSQALRI